MADEETCEKKILSYGIFFSPFHVYKERKKSYFLMETRNSYFFCNPLKIRLRVYIVFPQTQKILTTYMYFTDWD